MRIALICPQLPPHFNGCGDATDRLAKEFQHQGHSVLVLTDDVGHDYPYPVHSVGSWDSRAVRETRTRLSEFSPDVVLLQYTPFLYHPRSFYPAYVLRAIRGPRRIVYAHECFYAAGSAAVGSRPKAAYLALRDRMVLQSADDIYVASPARREVIAHRAPSLLPRTRVVPFGANIEPASGDLPRRAPREPYRLLTFGIVLSRRRVELLVRMLGELRERGVAANLDVAGRIQDAGYAAQCERLAQDLGVGNQLRFLGGLAPADLTHAFSECDLYLHAASEGAIPSAGSLLAALAHGVPIVCAKTTHDDARFGRAAVFAEAEPRALAASTAALLAAPPRLAAHGKRSRELYDAEFGWNRMADVIIGSAAPAARQAAL